MKEKAISSSILFVCFFLAIIFAIVYESKYFAWLSLLLAFLTLLTVASDTEDKGKDKEEEKNSAPVLW